MLCSLSIFSCSSLSDINKNFEKKYGKETKKIKAQRTPPKGSNHINVTVTPPTPREVEELQFQSTGQIPYGYTEVTKFGEKSEQNFFLNGESYEQTIVNPSGSLPPDLFEVTYLLGLSTAFQRKGAEFDAISIPLFDVYGVKTTLSDKTYLLGGNDALQRNIDQINSQKTKDDIEVSEILIREKNQQKRKERMVKIFGNEELRLEDNSDSEKEESPRSSKEINVFKKDEEKKDQPSGFFKKIIKD